MKIITSQVTYPLQSFMRIIGITFGYVRNSGNSFVFRGESYQLVMVLYLNYMFIKGEMSHCINRLKMTEKETSADMNFSQQLCLKLVQMPSSYHSLNG